MALQKKNADDGLKREESDVRKLVQKHLSDPNHVITDEELQNIKVGASFAPDAPTEEALAQGDDHIADHKADNENDILPGAQKMTPWDVVK